MIMGVIFLSAAIVCGIAAGRASEPDARKLKGAMRGLLGAAFGSLLYTIVRWFV